MAQLYKMGRHILEHLDNHEFRIDPGVSTEEIKKDYFNMIDSNLSVIYCGDTRVAYHKISLNSARKDYNIFGKIIDINNNIKTIEMATEISKDGMLSKLIYIQSVLRRGKFKEISKKISKNIANLRKILEE